VCSPVLPASEGEDQRRTVLNLLVEIALLAGVQCERRGALQQTFTNKPGSRIFLVGGKREGIDSKIAEVKNQGLPVTIGAMRRLGGMRA